jgi:hypothetical protein
VIHLEDGREKKKRTDEIFSKIVCISVNVCVGVYEKERNKSLTPTSIKEAVNIHKREEKHLCKMCVCARDEIF